MQSIKKDYSALSQLGYYVIFIKDVESWHVGTHLQPQHFRAVGRSSGVQGPS